MDPKLFKDKVYVVTGGAAGIGLAIARQLLKYGAHVYALDIHKDKTEELSALSNDHLTYLQTDVRNRQQCHQAISSIVASHKRLDGLVNNAGVCPLEGELPGDDVYDYVFDVNVRGVWNMATEALIEMKRLGVGSIVNIGSTSSVGGVPRIPLYTASKHAVLGLTRTWALDFAKYGIRVNCVGPGKFTVPKVQEHAILTCFTGPTDTAMARAPLQTVMGPRFGGGKTDDELLQMVAQSVPLGKIGSPDDIAHTVNFLLSDLAGYITGQMLPVSGGT